MIVYSMDDNFAGRRRDQSCLLIQVKFFMDYCSICKPFRYYLVVIGVITEDIFFLLNLFLVTRGTLIPSGKCKSAYSHVCLLTI